MRAYLVVVSATVILPWILTDLTAGIRWGRRDG
jgi:hypothetical protein